MLFGTRKNLAKHARTLNVTYGNHFINPTTTYKYLGVDINSPLNMNTNFDRTYKKASGRQKLLRKIRLFLNDMAAKVIYRGMVLPILTYCGILNLNMSSNRENKLLLLHDRAMDTITPNVGRKLKIKTPLSTIKIEASQLVGQFIDGNVCSNFINYFVKCEHDVGTRNNRYQLELSKIRLEYSRGSFYFMEAKLYNDLPLQIRKTEDYESFTSLLIEYFSLYIC